MCDYAKIQEHIPGIGDFYWEKHIDGQETIWVVYDTGNDDYEDLDWGTIWLPRQDQLQEMLEEKSLPHLAWLFDKFCNPNPLHPYYKDCQVSAKTSMEQLWFSFVMKENHNKVWSGTEWLNE